MGKLPLNCCPMYHKLPKRFGKLIRSFSELSSKFGALPFQECMAKEISRPVFYRDLVYKLRRIKSSTNFIPSGTKSSNTPSTSTVWASSEHGIIKKIDLLLDPSTAEYSLFTLTRQRRLHDGPCPNHNRGDKVPSFVPYDC